MPQTRKAGRQDDEMSWFHCVIYLFFWADFFVLLEKPKDTIWLWAQMCIALARKPLWPLHGFEFVYKDDGDDVEEEKTDLEEHN